MDSKFYCEICNYKTDYNSKYELHIKTDKHKRNGKKKNIYVNHVIIKPLLVYGI